MRKLHAEREKQGLMPEQRNTVLINEQNHLQERMCQYKNEKAEREVSSRRNNSQASWKKIQSYLETLEVTQGPLKKKK